MDDNVVTENPFLTMTGRYSLCGESLCIGDDGGDAVSTEYKSKCKFKGSRGVKVVFDLADDQYIDVERKFAEARARE